MSPTLEQARAAKKRLRGELTTSLEVIAIGIEKLPAGFGLKVNLRRKPRDDEQMPLSYDGVPIRYEVIGVLRALAS